MELLDIHCTRYNLSNGLEVILYQNNLIPLIAVNVWYKVGSANEVKGKTGLAHLFEHMMFQGSENVPKEMHFKYIQEAGGTLNGSTSVDRTNYYEKLPSNELELALWLESDRMGFFLQTLNQEKLDNQKSVVYNERLERYDNQPYGLAWEIIITNLYDKGHPYSWSTIGFPDDIKSYTFEDVTGFFKKYYSPKNASLVIAGNIDVDHTKSLVEKYFAGITSNDDSLTSPAKDAILKKTKLVVHKDKVQLERLYCAWLSDKAFGKDDASLDILSDILTGSKNSRLYKRMVFDMEIAQDVTAFQFSGKYSGHFVIAATAKPGNSLDKLKSVIDEEINLVIKKGISSHELERSKNSINSGFIYSLQNIDSLADQLNLYNFHLNEPNSFNYDLNRYNAVTESDISRVAEKYLLKPRVELKIIPEDKNGN